MNNWLICMQATIEKWSATWFDLRDHVVFSWPSVEDIRIPITLTLFISPPQFALALEAAVLGFHGSRQSSSAPIVSSLGLVFPLSPVFGLKSILIGCGFSLCNLCRDYRFPWLDVYVIFLSSSSWLDVCSNFLLLSSWLTVSWGFVLQAVESFILQSL